MSLAAVFLPEVVVGGKTGKEKLFQMRSEVVLMQGVGVGLEQEYVGKKIMHCGLDQRELLKKKSTHQRLALPIINVAITAEKLYFAGVPFLRYMFSDEERWGKLVGVELLTPICSEISLQFPSLGFFPLFLTPNIPLKLNTDGRFYNSEKDEATDLSCFAHSVTKSFFLLANSLQTDKQVVSSSVDQDCDPSDMLMAKGSWQQVSAS